MGNAEDCGSALALIRRFGLVLAKGRRQSTIVLPDGWVRLSVDYPSPDDVVSVLMEADAVIAIAEEDARAARQP